MTDTISVASRAHTAIRIAYVPPDGAPIDTSVGGAVLNGSNHPDAVAGEGVTHGVDAGLFRRWMDRMKAIGSPLVDVIYEKMASHEEEKVEAADFGFEPGLDRLADNSENTGKAEEGGTVTKPAPVTDTDMAATSEVPAGLEGVPPDQIPTTVVPPADKVD